MHGDPVDTVPSPLTFVGVTNEHASIFCSADTVTVTLLELQSVYVKSVD